jgi:hypothetical protein
MNYNLTTNASNEAESPAFLVGAVSSSAIYQIKIKLLGGVIKPNK